MIIHLTKELVGRSTVLRNVGVSEGGFFVIAYFAGKILSLVKAVKRSIAVLDAETKVWLAGNYLMDIGKLLAKPTKGLCQLMCSVVAKIIRFGILIVQTKGKDVLLGIKNGGLRFCEGMILHARFATRKARLAIDQYCTPITSNRFHCSQNLDMNYRTAGLFVSPAIVLQILIAGRKS